jgi:hypothetical protein
VLGKPVLHLLSEELPASIGLDVLSSKGHFLDHPSHDCA